MGDSEWTECKKRSDIWKYFLLDNKHKDKVKCKKCETVLFNYKSSTTDMWRHLERSHQMSSSKNHSGDEYFIPNEDSMGRGSFESRIESQQHMVIKPSASLRSEMAEVSSLLSLAMPMANINLLVDEGEGKDDAVAIEVRPRERLFRVSVSCQGWEAFQSNKSSTFPSHLFNKGLSDTSCQVECYYPLVAIRHGWRLHPQDGPANYGL